MKLKRTINFLLITVGVILGFYATSASKQNTYILVVAIVMLMVGLYRLSKGVPSKNTDESNCNTQQNLKL